MGLDERSANYALFKTAFGWCALAWTQRGLKALVPAMPTRESAEKELLSMLEGAGLRASEGKKEIEVLKEYFEGQDKNFSKFRLDLDGATEFQVRVWRALKNIPYGSTRTYRWVAEQIGRPEAVRAVGNAIGRNPLPVIIPCHRVIGSDGKLHGYSACGGVGLKRKLLALEQRPKRLPLRLL
jgi:methylated-DNA-[protein]-cysteine S-methyltransferase